VRSQQGCIEDDKEEGLGQTLNGRTLAGWTQRKDSAIRFAQGWLDAEGTRREGVLGR
jgi:hypothetical protein